MVRSAPSRTTSARPIGTVKSLGGLGQLAGDVVEHQVLDEEHRVVVADGGLQQPVGVARRRRRHDLQARACARTRPRGSASAGRSAARRRRRACGSPSARPPCRRTCSGSWRRGSRPVHRHQDEVDRHDLDDRAQAEHGRADAGADEALLGDRRLAHALARRTSLQPGGDLVGALEAPISSPIRKTRSSRSSSSSSARRSASR